MRISFYLSIISILCFISCKTQKIVPEKIIKKPTSTEVLLNSYSEFSKEPLQSIKFESKIETDLAGNSINLNADIYIEPNNVIWSTVYYFGFMGGRALITSTEIKGYEKLNRTFVQEEFSFINKKLNIQGLNITFNDFENILLGRLFFLPTAANYQYKANGMVYELFNLNLMSNAKEKYVEKVNFDLSFRPLEIILKDNISQKRVQIKYEQWTNINGFNYPKEIYIKSLEDNKLKFQITHKNAELIKWNPPFVIPENYKKRKL